MRSARRRLIKSREIKVWKKGIILPAIILIAILAFCLWFFVISAHFWNGSDKLAVTSRRENGDASVIVFDPKLSEITTLTIPGDTEVNVARNLGTMRLKNVWQLGENEKATGKLLAETLTNNFRFVSFLWIDSAGEGLVGSNFLKLTKFLFVPGSTNLSFRDRLGIVIFSSKVGNSGRTEIDLAKSLFLQKGKLSDGEAGFKISENLMERLTIYFSDYSLAEGSVRSFINDETGEFGVANEFGKIIETMGAKVVSIDKKTVSETDCVVSGGERVYVEKIARIFSCKEVISGEKNVISINIGSKFAKRF